MRILLLTQTDITVPLRDQGHSITYDPGDAVDCVVVDSVAIQAAPEDLPLFVLLSNTIADWTAKKTRPDATFVTNVEELLASFPAEPEKAAPAGPSERLLILTHSNKGGVGKSSSAIALSETLSQNDVQVCLIDLDFTAPDIATFYNLHPVDYFTSRATPQRVKPYLSVLPAPGKTIPIAVTGDDILSIINQMPAQVVICDTPPAPWPITYLHPVFASADLVYSIVDQSAFSIEKTKKYAPTLLGMGVTPEKIRVIVNRYTPKGTSIKMIERAFVAGFKRDIKTLPQVTAVIPENWEGHIKALSQGKVLDMDVWQRPCMEIMSMLGHTVPEKLEKPSLLSRFKRR